jgi:DNA helicase-2/ATP-dependent DNA helicase PcrA
MAVYQYRLATDVDEQIWVAREIQKLLRSGYAPQEIAIIARKHRHLQEISQSLLHQGLPIFYERAEEVLEHPYIQPLVQILELVYSLMQVEQGVRWELLMPVLSHPFWGISRESIWQLCRAYREQRQQDWLSLAATAEDEKLAHTAQFLRELGTQAGSYTVEELLEWIIGQEKFRLESGGEFVSPYKKYFFEEPREQKNPKYLDFLSHLQTLYQSLREFKLEQTVYLSQMMQFLELVRSGEIRVNNVTPYNKSTEAINLLTAHKAKGLEFQVVFVIRAEQASWESKGQASKLGFPKSMYLQSQAESEEDYRRLLYVSVTRSKSELYVTMPQVGKSSKMLEPTGLLPNKWEDVEPDLKAREELLKVQVWPNYQQFTPREEELLKAFLENYHLSVTHLENFLDVTQEGPQNFLETNLLRFPQAKNVYGAYGSAIHQTLHFYYTQWKRGESLGSERLGEKFRENLEKQDLNQRDFQDQLYKGWEKLENFYHQYLQVEDLEKYREVYSEKDFGDNQVNFQETCLKGKIDKLLVGSENIIVVDFKTGKPLKGWDKGQDFERIKSWKYRLQLTFYKILVENSDWKLKQPVTSGQIEFVDIEPEQFPILPYSIPEEEVRRLESLIQIVYNKILNLDFPDTSGYAKNISGIREFEEDLLAGRV